ncbi:MAG: hypothetical protein Q9O62_06885 [Ardenticatenia bacterium]|nr:hypothetical protein [Ardenticatenia bacterium]
MKPWWMWPVRWTLLLIVVTLLSAGDVRAASVPAASPRWGRSLAEDSVPAGENVWRRVHATSEVRLFFLPGSAAERDASLIAAEVRRSVRRVRRALQITEPFALDIYLVERLFWQGGVAYGQGRILITYSDRNYAAVLLRFYLDHEITHALAQQLVPEGGSTNALLAEGLATWVSGGHYWPEPIHQTAAALARSRAYVSISSLAEDFRSAHNTRPPTSRRPVSWAGSSAGGG